MLTAAAQASFNFTDAQQQGVFNMGDAQVSIAENRIDYRISGNNTAGVWTKDYPAELVSGGADHIQVSITAPESAGIAIRIEIKGTAGIQTLNVPLNEALKENIDWSVVGELNEVVLLIQRIGGADPALGSLEFDITFGSMGAFEKFNSTLLGQLAGILSVALLSMLIAFVPVRPVGGIVRDMVLGLATALILAVAFGIYRLTCIPLYFAMTGVAIGVLLKLALVGKSLTQGEAFRNALFTGLFAVTASTANLWQAPSAALSFVQLSAFGAALFALVYHVANAYRLTAFKKHLGSIGAGVITATPFAFGLLLAVQNAGAIWAQALLVFAFAEFVANAASLIPRHPVRKRSGM